MSRSANAISFLTLGVASYTMTLGNEMKKNYDVIIVGGGPAGIFAALEIAQGSSLSVLLIEKGRDISGRQCPSRDRGKSCAACSPCSLVCGLGGAGAFSDGKLTLTSQIGGRLKEYIGEGATESLIKYVDDIYLRFGVSDRLYGVGEEVAKLARRASLAELHLIPVPLRHLGTEHCRRVLKAMHDFLVPRIDLKLETAVSEIIV
ncbi:MAG: FAD-dependent oxidoreductase, partial [Chloroflexi bacterium]|nr:FAD-dependent oxidoreductase [Chloroflexota bacterium]